MFLWVDLILYDLKTSARTSQHAIQKKLKSLPKSHPDLYEKILLAIQPEDLELANSILRWVVWTECPLTLEELMQSQYSPGTGRCLICPEWWRMILKAFYVRFWGP
jgi:hypothetical protein